MNKKINFIDEEEEHYWILYQMGELYDMENWELFQIQEEWKHEEWDNLYYYKNVILEEEKAIKNWQENNWIGD